MTRSLPPQALSSIVIALALGGCGGASTGPQGQPSTTPSGDTTAPALASVEDPAEDLADAPLPDLASLLGVVDPSMTPPDREHHARAREAVRDGRLAAAKRLLGRLAFAYPQSAVLVDQYNAVGAHIEGMRATAKASLEATPLRTLDAPPAKYTLVRPARTSDEAVAKLVKSSDKKNQIVDDEDWYAKNDLHGLRYFVPPATDMLFAPGTVSTTTVMNHLTGFTHTEYEPQARFHREPLPLMLPLSYGSLPLTDAIDSRPYLVASYGNRIVAVFDVSGSVVGLFDFASYVHPPASHATEVVIGEGEVTTSEGTFRGDVTVAAHSIAHDIAFALAADDVLYIQHSNLRYAKENRGQNGYISAIDLPSGDLLWRSAPLTANGRSFALVGGGLVCGYGFTAEPDFLSVLDRATGSTRQKISLRKAPMMIIAKGRSIFVRTYDRDLVFDVR
jgi:hypothetical protein